jgi:ribosome biogenesis GTPase A
VSIPNFDNLFQWADQLVAVMKERRREEIVTQISEAKKLLAENVFTLAVLGKAKRGKSTLINALLGRKDDTLAPIDKLPASSAITRFRYGNEKAAVAFRDGHREVITYAQIRDYVTEEFNRNNVKEVAIVEVSGTFSKLPPQVELVDTPGSGSVHTYHDELLHAFIPQADAVIFIVTARMPLDQDEIELLREVKKADINKIFFVINKIDDSEPDEIASAVSHNTQLLAQNGIALTGFHQISAKNAFLDKGDSGVPELMNDLQIFLMKNKGTVLCQRFLSKVNGIVESELRTIEVTYSSGSKTIEELDADILNIQTQKKNLADKREYQEKEFQRKWREAVDDFQSKLGTVEQNVAVEIANKINNTWSLGVGKLVKTLPTFMNDMIMQTLDTPAKRLEEAVKSACETLNTDYPVLATDDVGKAMFKTRGDMTTTKGVVVAATAVVGGYGLTVAGATTAAGITAANVAAVAATTTAASTLAAATTAAASTIASTTTTTGILGAAANFLGGLFGFGTAAAAPAAIVLPTSTVAAPTLLATPIWVALAGPIGWTLAGVGVLAVPFAWQLSKLKQKDKIEEQAKTQIKEIFQGIRDTRIPALQKMGDNILDGVRNNLDYQIKQLEDALQEAKEHRPSPAELETLKRQLEVINRLIAQGAEWFNAT